jgi:transcriptional regulator with XRE-family HTH domain
MKKQKKAAEINPLKVLRALARSESAPLSQAELAEASTIPVDSIRGIENNRRTLTETHLHRIKVNLGAEWDPKRKTWFFAFSPATPYSAELYEKFRTKWFQHPRQAQIEADLLCRRLLELIMQVEDADYNNLFYRLFDFLDETRTELHITGARRVFDQTNFEIKFSRDAKTKEINLIFRQFPQWNEKREVLDFRPLTRPESPEEPPKDWASSPPFTGAPWPAVPAETPKKKKTDA